MIVILSIREETRLFKFLMFHYLLPILNDYEHGTSLHY